ncbi:MAG: PASTA domain-containing protein [Oscillospiraceae bacterium]|nr:PASTA domain-containing protein [Oscillospiraceae bacterium]
MRPKITDKEWDKIVQDAFSAGAPEPHFSEEYCAKRQKLERKLAMKEERKNAFQPGLVLATVGALLIAAVPAGMIVMMNRAAAQPKPDPGAAVMETFAETVTETEETAETGVAVPDLTGYRYEYTKKMLEQDGFTVDMVYEQVDTMSDGSVIRMEPAPGTVQPQGSTVTIYVAQNAEAIEENGYSTEYTNCFEMPDLCGMQEEQAKTQLMYFGADVEIVYEPSEEYTGTVIAQSIAPGEVVEWNGKVTLTIASENN